jgi:hypothetical protein
MQTGLSKRVRFTVALSLAFGLAELRVLSDETDFTYTTNNGAITITGYKGPWGSVEIPAEINGMPVTSIGAYAFNGSGNLTSVHIGNGVTSIGEGAFFSCGSLTNVTIGNGLTRIGAWAFNFCPRLIGVCFKGNAPGLDVNVFYAAENVVVFYSPGTTGWGLIFGGRPTAQWRLPQPVILTSRPGFGIQTNRFGFIISWATNVPVLVEASPTLTNSAWSAVSTNALTNGSSYFSDPDWAKYPSRFYRIRSK